MNSTASNEVIPMMDKIFSEFGIPRVVKSDIGPPFSGKDLRHFAINIGFKQHKITTVWPRASGEVERFVRTVMKVLKISRIEKKNFKQDLNRHFKNSRAAPYFTISIPPATDLFGRPMKTKLPEKRCETEIVPPGRK